VPRLDLALAPTGGGPTSSDPELLAAGTRVGRFTVLDLLGVGAMGVVLAAYDPRLDRRVALKLVRPNQGPHDGESEARLQREARAMARLDHPNILAVYEVGTHQRRVYLAMEHVEGTDLRREIARLRAAGEVPWWTIVDLYLAAGRGLAAAHAAGLVHRDFKPDNVLVGSDGRVLVCDFGLATGSRSRASEAGDNPGGTRIDERITQGDVVLGTPAYMPPEQHSGETVDPRADQFAFCVSLWEALMGELPFAGRRREEYLVAVARGDLRAPTGCQVPDWVIRALARGLRADPEERYPDMDELLAELHHPPFRLAAIAAPGVVILIASLIARLGEMTHARLAAAQAVVALALAILAIVLRQPRRHSPLGAKVILLVLCAQAGALLVIAGIASAGLPAAHAALVLPMLWSTIGLVLAVTTLCRWFWIPCAAYAAAFLISATWFSLQVPAVAVAHVLALTAAYFAIRPPPPATEARGPTTPAPRGRGPGRW
jgi:hypothetical protein